MIEGAVSFFISHWLLSDTLIGVMQNAGLAMLAILIPLVIAILQEEIIHKRNENNEGFLKLDTRVILDEVLRFKELLIFAGMIFLPLLFWGFSENILSRFIIFFVWALGMVEILFTILNIYKWVKGDLWKYRSKYLDQTNVGQDAIISWRSVWSSKVDRTLQKSDQKGFSIGDEFDLLKKFTATISGLIKKDD
ncbi:MAG: hypothetical protein NT077_03350 [Candidatus Taylorbacteria bacterium]|nr:hypothetical protein [Candidatus Taylorbacteria bacterium]